MPHHTKKNNLRASRLPRMIAIAAVIALLTATVMTSDAHASTEPSPDVAACLKTIAEKEREFKPLSEKILALKDDGKDGKNTKIKQDFAKLRDAVNLERLKTMPPVTLVDCNRMLSDLNAAIRFASFTNEKSKP